MRSTKQLQDSNIGIHTRLRKTALKYGIILLIGILYLVFILLTELKVPCFIYELTGLRCPGCGITRMIVSLARLDFTAAFGYNPFLFITGPLILLYLAVSEIRYVLYADARMGRWEAFISVELVLAIVYGVLRNIFPI